MSIVDKIAERFSLPNSLIMDKVSLLMILMIAVFAVITVLSVMAGYMVMTAVSVVGLLLFAYMLCRDIGGDTIKFLRRK